MLGRRGNGARSERWQNRDVRRETLFRVTNVFLKQFFFFFFNKTLPFQKFYRYIYFLKLKTPFVLKKNAHFIF